MIYEVEKREIQQAEEYYNQVSKDDGNPEAYACVNYRLGYIYETEKRDLKQAKRYYRNVKEKDNPQMFSYAQYRLGYIYETEKRNLKQAEHHYQNTKYSSLNFSEYVSAQVTLDLIQYNLTRDNRDAIVNKIVKIREFASNIQRELLVKFDISDNENKKTERRVAHYTKPQVLFHLLKRGDNGSTSNFRLNIVDVMNDPTSL